MNFGEDLLEYITSVNKPALNHTSYEEGECSDEKVTLIFYKIIQVE